MSRNRMGNAKNQFQGSDIRVLTVCSAGLLRSPTLARLLHRRFKNVNCRPVGINTGSALVPLDNVHVFWADVILVMESWMSQSIEKSLNNIGFDREMHCLNIPNKFSFGDPELEKIMNEKIDSLLATLRSPAFDSESYFKDVEELKSSNMFLRS